MGKRPPHIVVTTPESLYILLSSESGRAMLKTTRAVIVDEIHALAPNKRGSHLCPLAGAAIVTLRGRPTEDRTIGNPEADRRGRTFLGRCGFGG